MVRNELQLSPSTDFATRVFASVEALKLPMKMAPYSSTSAVESLFS
jgi:hypothetical protein